MSDPSGEAIPANVKAFLAESIDSVLQLEVLLLLAGTPERSWNAGALSKEMRIDSAWAVAQLAQLRNRGLLAAEGADAAFRYAPRTPELDQAVKTLAVAYAQRRVTIIGLIFAKPPSPIRDFADAFRFRRDKPDA